MMRLRRRDIRGMIRLDVQEKENMDTKKVIKGHFRWREWCAEGHMEKSIKQDQYFNSCMR